MIRAGLFDLDGTLLDSMYVWNHVDACFFARRGLEMPSDYPMAISGMSFVYTARYTKARFDLPEDVEEIMAEWTALAREEYALRVPLKKGALEFLRALGERGVRLCVVTTLLPELSGPCLARNGVDSFFEFILTTHEAGSRVKSDGHVYRAAAQRLGVDPADCAVFEDVEAGIVGARACGMRAYCVQDPISTHHPERIRLLADGMSDNIMEFLARL